MRRVLLAMLALVMILVAGCGVAPERRPIPIDLAPAAAPVESAPEAGPLTVVVYYIRGDRLEAVERAVSESSGPALLGLLTAGPSRAEVVTGLRTALTPQTLTVTTSEEAPDTAEVAVTQEFTGITGENQLLAVAQLVWTVTELPGITRVRLSVDGESLEIPTDRGLSQDPVERADYMSIAPAE